MEIHKRAFFTALTILNKESYFKNKNVGFNPTRIGFYEILKTKSCKKHLILKN